MDLLAVSVPLITTGLLLPVVLVYAYIYIKFPRRIYLSVLLLTLAGFFYVLFDFLTIHSSIIPTGEAAALQYNRLQELASSAFIPLLPFFLSAILQMTSAVRKLNSVILLLGIVFFAVIALGAFILPDSFLSVTRLRIDPAAWPVHVRHGDTGLLFKVRDLYMVFLVLYSLVLITVDLFLFRDYNYLFQLLIGFVIALVIGSSALIKNITGSYQGLLADFTFSRVGASLAIFTLFGLSTYLRYFLNEAKIVHRAKGSLEEKERELQLMAYYDELTSLQNRKSFFINLGKRRPTEADTGRQRAICLIDLDTFGAIVDAYGQEISDFLLALIAQRLQDLFHQKAVLFRIGGDEFALTTNDFIESGEIDILAKEILEAFQHPFEIGADHLFVSASVGIALSPENGEAPEELYKNAMRALSRAKVDRNTYAMYSPEMTLHASERLTLIHGLRESIATGAFSMYYQPIFDSQGTVSGAEALIRWDHPDHREVSPAVFMPLAEISGLILPLSDWIIRQVARDISFLEEQGLTPNISLNLSAKQFKVPQLCDSLIEVFRPHGIQHEKVSIEITESSLVHNFEQIKQVLKCFQSHGFTISIDDFGTGYSSLSYLRELPFDKLKIDKAFVQKLDEDLPTRSLVSSIIDLGKKMGYKLIAEGVETKMEIEFLRSNSCDYFQGFLLSRPVPFEDFTEILKDHAPHPLFLS